MSSSKIVERAKILAKKHQAVFDTLQEFEQTKKIRTKHRLNFTISKNTASRFKRYCKVHGYNMSAKIQQAMEDIVKKKL